ILAITRLHVYIRNLASGSVHPQAVARSPLLSGLPRYPPFGSCATAGIKLQTELRVLSFLLKDRVYPGDLWEIIGERTIEVKQEATLLQHQSTCIGGSKGKRHVMIEHLLMEERKNGARWRCLCMHDMMTFSTTSRRAGPCASPFCPTATRNKCDAWLKIPHSYPLRGELFMEMCSYVDRSTLSKPGLTIAHEDKRASVILNCVGPSLPLLSTWVAVDVQEAFYSAVCAEQACQARLMTQTHVVNNGYPYQRNIGLEWFTLQAKMRRAQAEIELYTVAIANAREFDCYDNISTSSSFNGFIPPPRPDELCYYGEDHDTDNEDSFDFEVE
ncbi:hypothetical protein C8R48DRAFT_679624, partial [Suillus tomentosus]